MSYEAYLEKDINYDSNLKKWYLWHSTTGFAIWFDTYEQAVCYVRSR